MSIESRVTISSESDLQVCESHLKIKARPMHSARIQVRTSWNTHLRNPPSWKQPKIDLVCEETYFRLRCFTTWRQTVFKVQRSHSHLDNVCVCVLIKLVPDLLCNYSWISVHLRISCVTSNKSELTSSVCSVTNTRSQDDFSFTSTNTITFC